MDVMLLVIGGIGVLGFAIMAVAAYQWARELDAWRADIDRRRLEREQRKAK